MLLRALFWISLVAVLMPREPGFGFGRSHQAPSSFSSSEEGDTKRDCKDYPASCAARFGVFDSLQTFALRSLIEVKAELERPEHVQVRAVSSGD